MFGGLIKAMEGLTVLSYVFYKQTLNWQTSSGLFLIIMGVTIASVYKKRGLISFLKTQHYFRVLALHRVQS